MCKTCAALPQALFQYGDIQPASGWDAFSDGCPDCGRIPKLYIVTQPPADTAGEN